MNKDKRQSIKENLRLFQLDALFQNGGYFTAQNLEEKLHVSPATFNRDIKNLRERYNAPLVFDKDKCAYHYSSKLFKLPAYFATEEEMPAYSLVLKLFEMFKDTPLYFPLVNICETFETPIETTAYFGLEQQSSEVEFKTKPLPEKQWFETRIIMAERPADIIEETVWETILHALKNNQQLKFDYETVTENRKSYSRIIEPWQLIYDREQWYLTGLSTVNNSEEKKVRTFVVPRMKNLKLLETRFKLPSESEWMLDKYGLGPFGVSTGGTAKKYSFIFQGSALYYSQAEFGPDQKTVPYTGPLPHEENAVLVSFTSNKEPAILREFFAYGSDIVPVEPADFVQKWKEKIQKMNNYL